MKKQKQKRAVRVVLTASVTVISSAALAPAASASNVSTVDKWAAIQDAYQGGQISYLEDGMPVRSSTDDPFRNTASPFSNQ